MRRLWPWLLLLAVVIAVIVVARMPRGERKIEEWKEQVQDWMIGVPEGTGPVFSWSHSWSVSRGETDLPTYSASGTTKIWLPAAIQADPPARETNAALTAWPSGEVTYVDTRWVHIPDYPPYDEEWMEHKYRIRAVILTEDAEEIWDEYETDWVKGEDNYLSYDWAFSFVVVDNRVVSTAATIGDASISYTFNVQPAVPDPICVSVIDPAWHGTYALTDYDGLSFEDICLNENPVDATEIGDDGHEYVTAYQYPSGVPLHIIGAGNTVRFTIDEAMASGLFTWGHSWCISKPVAHDPHLRKDAAGRLWLTFMYGKHTRGDIRVYMRESSSRDWQRRTNPWTTVYETAPAYAGTNILHYAPCICPMPDGSIMVLATRWDTNVGHWAVSRDDGDSWGDA